jgi:uncharacterized membrane protein SirB2
VLRVEQVVKDRLVVKDLSEILLRVQVDLQGLAQLDHRVPKVMPHLDQLVFLVQTEDLVLQVQKDPKEIRV